MTASHSRASLVGAPAASSCSPSTVLLYRSRSPFSASSASSSSPSHVHASTSRSSATSGPANPQSSRRTRDGQATLCTSRTANAHEPMLCVTSKANHSKALKPHFIQSHQLASFGSETQSQSTASPFAHYWPLPCKTCRRSTTILSHAVSQLSNRPATVPSDLLRFRLTRLPLSLFHRFAQADDWPAGPAFTCTRADGANL